LFGAQDPHGQGLWRTDGTPAGTERLALFGSQGVFSETSTPNFPILGKYLYFTATTDSKVGMQIWRTDGTAAGTHSFGQLGPDPNGRLVIFEASVGKRLLFSAGDTQGNLQLYSTDGSSISQLTAFSGPTAGFIGKGILIGAKFFFVAIDNSYAQQLWTTDGTASHTYQINSTIYGATYDPHGFVQAKDLVFYLSNGLLWTIDPKTDVISTVSTSDTPGFGPPNVLESANPLVVQSDVLFIDFDLAQLALWRSDGTATGTYAIANITPGLPTFNESSFPVFEKIGTRAVYIADDGVHGPQLWSSDGTAGNTKRLTDATEPTNASFQIAIPLQAFGDVGYFMISDGAKTTTWSLWCTDGTRGGTYRVPGVRSVDQSEAGNVLIAGGVGAIYISAPDPANVDAALYYYDKAQGKSTLLKSGLQNIYNSAMFFFDGSFLYFSENDSRFGDQPWVSNGTASGTHLLKDIYP
jgi:ELWxxDGT repeat protein